MLSSNCPGIARQIGVGSYSCCPLAGARNTRSSFDVMDSKIAPWHSTFLPASPPFHVVSVMPQLWRSSVNGTFVFTQAD